MTAFKSYGVKHEQKAKMLILWPLTPLDSQHSTRGYPPIIVNDIQLCPEQCLLMQLSRDVFERALTASLLQL